MWPTMYVLYVFPSDWKSRSRLIPMVGMLMEAEVRLDYEK